MQEQLPESINMLCYCNSNVRVFMGNSQGCANVQRNIKLVLKICFIKILLDFMWETFGNLFG